MGNTGSPSNFHPAHQYNGQMTPVVDRTTTSKVPDSNTVTVVSNSSNAPGLYTSGNNPVNRHSSTEYSFPTQHQGFNNDRSSFQSQSYTTEQLEHIQGNRGNMYATVVDNNSMAHIPSNSQSRHFYSNNSQPTNDQTSVNQQIHYNNISSHQISRVQDVPQYHHQGNTKLASNNTNHPHSHNVAQGESLVCHQNISNIPSKPLQGQHFSTHNQSAQQVEPALNYQMMPPPDNLAAVNYNNHHHQLSVVPLSSFQNLPSNVPREKISNSCKIIR